ncbi:hypothetical protein BKA69DRAFT_1077157 [Paraphysoderma sedebokerense]|nr:hypothetical protein BKA69DRAFT_1077157 [Paraphysoderma sedebokerense]
MPHLFSNQTAWFSPSVSEEHVELWLKYGGALSNDHKDKTIRYFFSADFDDDVTLELIKNETVLFRPEWIEDCIRRNQKVSLKDYFLYRHITEVEGNVEKELSITKHHSSKSSPRSQTSPRRQQASPKLPKLTKDLKSQLLSAKQKTQELERRKSNSRPSARISLKKRTRSASSGPSYPASSLVSPSRQAKHLRSPKSDSPRRKQIHTSPALLSSDHGYEFRHDNYVRSPAGSSSGVRRDLEELGKIYGGKRIGDLNVLKELIGGEWSRAFDDVADFVALE